MIKPQHSSKQLKEASLLSDIAKLAALINNHQSSSTTATSSPPKRKFSNLTLKKPAPVVLKSSPLLRSTTIPPKIIPRTPQKPANSYVRRGNKLVRINRTSLVTKVTARYSKTFSPSLLLRRKIMEMKQRKKKSFYSKKVRPKLFRNKLYVRSNHPPTPTKYSTPSKARKVTLNGQSYEMTPRGKTMVRTRNVGRMVASNRVKQSLKNARKKPQYCLFFNKFGKCNNDKCKYIHDLDKVSVCMKFLKGKCEDPKCQLQHKVDTDRMPVCWHFLKGVCTKENCIYSHVYVNPQAEVCPDFAKGYCANGRHCKLKHISTNKSKAEPTEEKKRKREDEEKPSTKEDETEDVFVSIRPRFKRKENIAAVNNDYEEFIDVNVADDE